MTHKVLFILAGYSASGKTTLLKNALENKVPLFGTEYDALFQSTRIPPRFPEWTIGFEETLQHGSWFSNRHLNELAQQENLPGHVVIHIDLSDLFGLAKGVTTPLPDAVAAIIPRMIDNLTNDAQNDLIAKHYWQNPLFKKFDHIIINTLYAPWETVAAQYWKKKAALQRDVMSKDHLFNPKRPRQDIHQSIYNSWLRSLTPKNANIALLSEVKNGALTIKQIDLGLEPSKTPTAFSSAELQATHS